MSTLVEPQGRKLVNLIRLWWWLCWDFWPFLNQGYHFYVNNFYKSVPLFKDLFAQGVLATGTILETRRGFPAAFKKSKEWAKGEKGGHALGKDPPLLVLQWVDNEVISMLSTIDKVNYHGLLNRKRKVDGVWDTREISQPKVVANFNKFMNGVDRSDQILTTNSVPRKSTKWWETLFYHLIDMAVVNSFILFKEHRA